MEKDESSYDNLYDQYLKIKKTKDFFTKRKDYVLLVFNLRDAYNNGNIESIESLPKLEEVYSYNESQLANLEKKLEELYFPDPSFR